MCYAPNFVFRHTEKGKKNLNVRITLVIDCIFFHSFIHSFTYTRFVLCCYVYASIECENILKCFNGTYKNPPSVHIVSSKTLVLSLYLSPTTQKKARKKLLLKTIIHVSFCGICLFPIPFV